MHSDEGAYTDLFWREAYARLELIFQFVCFRTQKCSPLTSPLPCLSFLASLSVSIVLKEARVCGWEGPPARAGEQSLRET